MIIVHAKVLNGNIWALNDFITKGRQKTYLSADVDSGGAALTVFSITGFSAGDYYALIGELGGGNTELIKMHAATAPSGTTVTLASNLSNNHSANEPVYWINFNQIEYSRATTTSGTKTVLTTADIDPTNKWSLYSDVTNSTGYAFIRFKNEAGTTFSAYSDPIPYTQSKYNTVDYILKEAMRETKSVYSETLTPDFLINQINECLRDIRKHKNKISWAQSYNAILGQTTQGVFRYSMPTDIFDKYSPKAINTLRIGGQPNLEYVDVNYFFDSLLQDVHFTQVSSAVTGGAGTTTLEVDNSYDFDDSGTISVASNDITYTAVTRDDLDGGTGAFTGVPGAGEDGAMATSIAVDDWVFQGESEGEPKYWTLFNGYIYIWPLCDSTWDNHNVYADYFKVVTSVDSASDEIDYIQYDLIKNWLKWKIRAHTRNDGVEDMEDSSFLLYSDQLNTLIRKDRNINRKAFRNIYEFGEDTTRDINPRQIRDGQI